MDAPSPGVVRIVLAYDGTDYHGWQVQPGLRTVQGELARAIAGLLPLEEPPAGAGRTDAGVHARGQVASVPFADRGEYLRLQRALPHRLPEDMALREMTAEAPGFHARFSATARYYVYRFLARSDPLRRRDHWTLRGPLDVAAMNEACQALLGARDCDSLCRRASLQAGRTRCVVRRAEVLPEGDGWALHVVADRFLHSMVRTLAGTLVEIGQGRRPPAALAAILEARDRNAAGPTAPAKGLCLEAVEYGERWALPSS